MLPFYGLGWMGSLGGMLTSVGLLPRALRASAGGAREPSRLAPGSDTVVLRATAMGFGYYHYLPFEVPSGVNRIDVRLERRGPAGLGIGLFDQRGAGYQSPGFRGILGRERDTFFVSADRASPSFLPGTIEPGIWTLIVPVFHAVAPVRITVTVRFGFGPQAPAPALRPVTGVVRDASGWYRGDLHCHTPESSDAWITGSALTAQGWADECRRIGLDFVSLTDHNVVSQNRDLGAADGDGILLMAGEEMTNWFHGHAIVTGVAPGEWLDWRQRPRRFRMLTHEARIADFLQRAKELGAYVAVAHPFMPPINWQFFDDADGDEPAGVAMEVWTGPFQLDDQAAVAFWELLLRRGRRVVASGGGDLHGKVNVRGFAAGRPTTVVYADRLAVPNIVRALKAGRSFVTGHPQGVEIYLSACGPYDQHEEVGGTVYGKASDRVRIEALVRRGAGRRLILHAGGERLSITPLSREEQIVTAEVPVAAGYVRAEVRGRPSFDLQRPLAGRLDMEALTNPIFLVQGAPPDGYQPFFAPPPPPPPSADEERMSRR